jgi:hypothetical protein
VLLLWVLLLWVLLLWVLLLWVLLLWVLLLWVLLLSVSRHARCVTLGMSAKATYAGCACEPARCS